MICRYCEAELNGTHAESCPLAQAKKRSLPYVEYDPRKETPEEALKRARRGQADCDYINDLVDQALRRDKEAQEERWAALQYTGQMEIMEEKPSLRDQFAMVAPIQMRQNTLGHYADNARDRYEWADAMLEERNKIHKASNAGA